MQTIDVRKADNKIVKKIGEELEANFNKLLNTLAKQMDKHADNQPEFMLAMEANIQAFIKTLTQDNFIPLCISMAYRDIQMEAEGISPKKKSEVPSYIN